MDWQPLRLPPQPSRAETLFIRIQTGRVFAQYSQFLRAHLAPITPLCHQFPPLPAFVFAAERFCPNYFSLPLLHQQYNTICRRSHFRFRNLFIIVSKSYPLTFNFPYQLLLQKLIFNLFSLFSFLSCFTCEGAFSQFSLRPRVILKRL